MSREEIEIGKQWLEQKLNEYAAAFEVSMEQMEWGEGKGDFENNLLSLALYVNGKRNIQKFSLHELEDTANDKSVRTQLENRLKRLVESFLAKPQKIGF